MQNRTCARLLSFLAILIANIAFPVFAESEVVAAMECNFWTQSYKRRDLSTDDPLVKACMVMAKASELLGSGLADTFDQSLPRKVNRRSTVIKLAAGLTSPDGLAVHPVSGDIYVSEEDASRVSVLRNGNAVRVIDRTTPVYCVDSGRLAETHPLMFPEGLAFSAEGDLYVVEDMPGGRLLKYELHERNGVASRGIEIKIPGHFDRVAWECIAVASDGAFAIAGSDAEFSCAQGEVPSFFSGYMLYRDADGDWWLVMSEPFASFSAVALSRDGTKLVYTCELNGTIGWIDLSGTQLRYGSSSTVASNPESIAVMPGGQLLVAEESGNLLLVNPELDEAHRLEARFDALETVMLDAEQDRILLTDDKQGAVWAMTLSRFSTAGSDALERAAYDPPHTPTHIPVECPEFLAEVLKFGGADFSGGASVGEVSFSAFADRVAIVSLDALAVPVVEGSDMEDPVTRLQFVVFNPNTIVMTENGVGFPLAIFILRRASGEVLTTRCNGVSASRMSLLLGENSALIHGRVPVPYPGAVNVSADGIANVHFLGLQQVPDFHVVLNPGSPQDSYVVVDRHDGNPTEYRLQARAGGSLQDDMVISYAKYLHTEWMWLGKDRGADLFSCTQCPSGSRTDYPGH